MADGIPTPIRYRRSVTTLSKDQLSLLRHGVDDLKKIDDDRGYRYLAGIHGLPLPIGCDNAHGTPYFLPWHRAYLYFFERAMRDQRPDSMLAWWDWTLRPAALPEAFTAPKNALRNGKVDPLALQQWAASGGAKIGATTTRQPGKNSSLPTKAEVTAVLRRADFVDFSNAVEQLHNRVHMWVGGHMGQIPFAAFDPIFWAHHTMIDRIWRLWQLQHPSSALPASLLPKALPPFGMTVAQTLDVTALGYDYAVASRSQPVVSAAAGIPVAG
jgi:tyrosinase